MMRRFLIIAGLVFFNALSMQAQDEEMEAGKAAAFTPFTGMDYVRIVFDKDKVLSAHNTYKVIIKSVADDKMLWQGIVKPLIAINEGGKQLSATIKNLKPVLWTPNNPFLYEVALQELNKGVVKETWKERAGFRNFERKGGNLFLNGKPIFLRGIAINPPGRAIPTEIETSKAFALEYERNMKSINVNIIRIPDDRLTLIALAKDYGYKKVNFKGPKIKNEFSENEKAVLEFESSSALMTGSDTLNGFEIGYHSFGDSVVFIKVQAKIERNKIIVWNDDHKEPVEVRNSLLLAGEANLFNKEGLPAFSFRNKINRLTN